MGEPFLLFALRIKVPFVWLKQGVVVLNHPIRRCENLTVDPSSLIATGLLLR